jgi:signal recognition particle GTPase
LINLSLQNDSMWIQNSKTFAYSVNELEVVFLCGQEVLLVLDGTTGLNMLPQAREFNQVKSSFEITHS